MNRSLLLAIPTVAAALLTAPAAEAGSFTQVASGACEGQRLQDQQALFRNLYELRNDSTSGIRVICSVPMIADQVPPNSQYEVSTFNLTAMNYSTKSVKITCSYRTTSGHESDMVFTAAVVIPANNGALIRIVPDSDRINTTGLVVSCNLPPHTAFTDITGTYREWEFVEMQ